MGNLLGSCVDWVSGMLDPSDVGHTYGRQKSRGGGGGRARGHTSRTASIMSMLKDRDNPNVDGRKASVPPPQPTIVAYETPPQPSSPQPYQSQGARSPYAEAAPYSGGGGAPVYNAPPPQYASDAHATAYGYDYAYRQQPQPGAGEDANRRRKSTPASSSVQKGGKKELKGLKKDKRRAFSSSSSGGKSKKEPQSVYIVAKYDLK